MRLTFLSLAVIAAAGCGQQAIETPSGPVAIEGEPGDPSAMTEQSAPIVVMLGDSLTAGYQLPAGAALPAALQRGFEDRGVKATFVNAGVSGDTTADGLQRYDWSVEGSNADLLIVALGANDFLQDLPPETPRKNLAAILERARQDNLPAVLIGVSIPGEAQDEREAAYAAIYPDLAAQYGIPYFPNMLGAIAGQPGLLMQDGIHPTAEGVEAMSDQIADFLAPLVEDLG